MYILWIGGASCDGCTTASLGATAPSLEDFVLGRVRDAPDVTLVHPLLALDSGDEYLRPLTDAAAGRLGPFVLVVEGSVIDDVSAGDGYFSRLGPDDAAPATTGDWVSRLAPNAEAVVAIGSCATWGGIPAAAGSVTGAKGLGDHLGARFRSRAGLPVINVPGCAPSGEAFMEVLESVLLHLGGTVRLELDEDDRPRWLYRDRTPPAPPRTAWTGASPPQRGAATVGCPVPARGWSRGMGGCARVGGACIGCTAPGFADRYLEIARPHRPA